MIVAVLLFCAVCAAAPDVPLEGDACERTAGLLRCDVHSLLAEREIALRSTHPEGAERLAVRCVSPHAESTLRDHHFARLQGLTEITIDHCKILRLPGNVFEGQRGLKALAVRTHNGDWAPNKQLDLSFGAFNGLRELHALDLGYNNIRKIPLDLFCALENLISLNLTHNHIKYVDQLGFGRKCGSTIQTIDLSYNEIMSLPVDSEIMHFRRLTQLLLQNNNITELPSDVFGDLLALKVLNLSNNGISSIPSHLFSNTKEIREIYLHGNMLETLPKRIFNQLEQLLVLDLSQNNLRSDLVEDGIFSGLIRLIVLDLSHNALTRISGKMIKDLFFLQILNLKNNSIGYIEDNAFSPLFNLHTLNLGENRLHTIEEYLFNGLYILNKLTLNNNLLSYINENAFKNCSDLKELDLSSNQLKRVPTAIWHLSFLKSLDLGENLLTDIDTNSFHNLSQLTGLRLIDNQIGNLTAGMFTHLPNLQVLNLAKNKIQTIETETFQRNTQLEAIRLDGNFIADINGVFVSLTKLLWLNLSENHLVWFDYAFIPGSLKWLDVHANFIEILGNYYKIQDLHVTTLDVSHNRLVAVTSITIPNSVELLFINNNFITTIDTDTFLDKANLTRVDMYANELEQLDLNSLRLTRVPDEKLLPEFYVSGNPFRCDCSMKWLLLINNMTSRQYPRVMDLNNVICKESYVRGTKHMAVSELKTKDFLCRYDSHCSEKCHCCDYNDCKCRITCPRNCSCYHDSTKTTSVVDCSNLKLSILPELPLSVTHIYLDGNNYVTINNTLFSTLTGVQVLYLNVSNVEYIHNRTFNALTNLQILHLEKNKLKQLRGLEFEKLRNLRELYLQSNFIEYISNETFSYLSYLEILRLSGNRLVDYGLWHLDNNKKLLSLSIGHNYWSCECKYLQGFLTYVSQNIDKVADARDLWCLNNKAKPDEKKTLNLNGTVCNEGNGDTMVSALLVSNNLPLLASAITGLMLILLILALVFTFRYACRMWLFSNCGIKLSPLSEVFEDNDKLYDAYVCYSPKDEEFVVETLAREMETGYPSYHVCLHYRDVPQFEATYAQFPDLVVEATQASRRIIVVLTRNFIRTEWSHLEFRQALQRALRKNPHKLILVTIGPVPRDSELKSYFKTSLEISWKEKRFWERLRYAMPASKRHGHKLKRLNYGRNSNTYTMDASVLNGTCQTLCGKSAASERSPCERPLSEHIYSTIDSDYSSTDRNDFHTRPNQHVVMEHTVQTYLV